MTFCSRQVGDTLCDWVSLKTDTDIAKKAITYWYGHGTSVTKQIFGQISDSYRRGDFQSQPRFGYRPKIVETNRLDLLRQQLGHRPLTGDIMRIALCGESQFACSGHTRSVNWRDYFLHSTQHMRELGKELDRHFPNLGIFTSHGSRKPPSSNFLGVLDERAISSLGWQNCFWMSYCHAKI